MCTSSKNHMKGDCIEYLYYAYLKVLKSLFSEYSTSDANNKSNPVQIWHREIVLTIVTMHFILHNVCKIRLDSKTTTGTLTLIRSTYISGYTVHLYVSPHKTKSTCTCMYINNASECKTGTSTTMHSVSIIITCIYLYFCVSGSVPFQDYKMLWPVLCIWPWWVQEQIDIQPLKSEAQCFPVVIPVYEHSLPGFPK